MFCGLYANAQKKVWEDRIGDAGAGGQGQGLRVNNARPVVYKVNCIPQVVYNLGNTVVLIKGNLA